jgi:hypothetical protein
MADSPLKYVDMFGELCGKKDFQNVILTTTKWDEVDQETGEQRERELKADMLERGSTTNRFMGTRESALTVIDPLIDAAIKRNTDLILADMRKFYSTSEFRAAIGEKLISKMEPLLRQREDLLRRIRNRVTEKRRANEIILDDLQDEYRTLKNAIDRKMHLRRLKLYWKHLKKMSVD